MRRVFCFLFVALMSTQQADYAEARKSSDREVIVTLLGEDLTRRDLLSRAQRRGKNVQQQAEQAAKALHERALKKLIAHRLPECRMQANDGEVAQYITWWRTTWSETRRATARRLADYLRQFPASTGQPGGSDAEPAPEGPEASRQKDPNERIIDHLIRARHKPDDINIASRSAVNVAKADIENWLAFKCVQDKYAGDVFYSLEKDVQKFSVSQPGNEAARAPLLEFRLVDGFPLPATPALPKPAGSLVAFFEAAEAEGQLVFKNAEMKERFFSLLSNRDSERMPAEDGILRLKSPHWVPQETAAPAGERAEKN